MWKDAGVASLKYDPNIYMERRKRNTKGPGKYSRSSDQDFSLETSELAAETLFTDSEWKLKTVSFKMALLLTPDVCCRRYLFARTENHRSCRLLYYCIGYLVLFLTVKCLLNRRLGASHWCSDRDSGLANEPDHTSRPGHLTNRAGSFANSALFFIGQKPTDDLYMSVGIPDLHRRDAYSYVSNDVQDFAPYS
jgi:hypothetical protein